MKQLGFLVVSLSLLSTVIATQSPDSRLSATRVSAPAAEAAPDSLDLEVAIGWALAGSLIASVLMGGLVYRYSLKEFDAWTRSALRARGLHLGVSTRTVANQTN